MESEYTMKVAMLGESGVGKTCLIERYAAGQFRDTQSTKGATFKPKVLKSLDGRIELKQMLWDTAGQEIYRSLAPFYYKDADAVVAVYDTTNLKSFEALSYWVNEVKQNGRADCLLTLAGNKCDCVDNEAVSLEAAKNFALANNAKLYLTSARDNLNVREMYIDLAMRKFPFLGKRFGFDDSKIVAGGDAKQQQKTKTGERVKLGPAKQTEDKRHKNCKC